ncbi:MAG: ROK family protein [Acidimicrobiales bacterium]
MNEGGQSPDERAYAQGGRDPAAQKVWREAIAGLVRALATCVALLDPELVVIGGGLAGAGEALFGPVSDQLEREAPLGRMPRVVPAGLGEKAGAFGAALAAWRAAGAADLRAKGRWAAHHWGAGGS